MSYGSWLSEWMYGFIMVAIVSGMINGYSKFVLDVFRWDITLWLILTTFFVNFSWGMIDGLTVIYGGLTDKAYQENLLRRLKKDRMEPGSRGKILEMIDGSIATYLSDDRKEVLVDQIIEEGPEETKRYRLSNEDWNILIATVSCDVIPVIPVILPYIIFGFTDLALLLSRLFAAIGIGYLVFRYSETIGRRKWLAALVFFVLTFIMMAITYSYGW